MRKPEPWKKLLQPFAELHSKAYVRINKLSLAEMNALLDACEQVTQTNCWWATYRAAKTIRGDLVAERRIRLRERGPFAFAGIPSSAFNGTKTP